MDKSITQCNFCEYFDFRKVGVSFDWGEDNPHIYLMGGHGTAPKNERFKFCPMCGERINEEVY